MLESIPFNAPVFVNGHSYLQLEKMGSKGPFYIHLDMVKPGKNFFSVKNRGTYYLHRNLTRHRQE